MKAENSITLWHFDDTGVCNRLVFPYAHIYLKRGVTKSGIKEKGFHSDDSLVVRIPGNEQIDVSLGDYVAPGEHKSQDPDFRCALKVTVICDNRRGLSPHWKLLCGG